MQGWNKNGGSMRRKWEKEQEHAYDVEEEDAEMGDAEEDEKEHQPPKRRLSGPAWMTVGGKPIKADDIEPPRARLPSSKSTGHLAGGPYSMFKPLRSVQSSDLTLLHRRLQDTWQYAVWVSTSAFVVWACASAARLVQQPSLDVLARYAFPGVGRRRWSHHWPRLLGCAHV